MGENSFDFVRGSITVRPTSCLDSTKQVNLFIAFNGTKQLNPNHYNKWAVEK